MLKEAQASGKNVKKLKKNYKSINLKSINLKNLMVL